MDFEIYEDARAMFRWRAVAGNGLIIADGSEGYASRSNALRALERFLELARQPTPVVDR